jgi:proteic killer suppression protein
MKIKNVIPKGLRRFIEQDDAGGLQPAVVEEMRRVFSFLQDIGKEDELRTVPSWKARQLTSGRKGTWNLYLTKSWRMTLRIDRDEVKIINFDCEDCH